MITASWRSGALTVVAAKAERCLVTAAVTVKGRTTYHSKLLKGGVGRFDVKTERPDSVRLTHIKSKLKEGEHRSPPKGYPKDKDQYALPEYYLFPIDTEEHVRAAIGYFDKHDWSVTGHKKEAARRILRAAKKHGIDVSKDDEVYRAAHED